LAEAKPMTHVEALDLDRLPEHLIVMGGGYVGLELSQAFRRFGSRVTLVQESLQLADHEDPDVGAALLDLFHDEGIDVLLGSRVRQVEGRSGKRISVQVENGKDQHVLTGTDILVRDRPDSKRRCSRLAQDRCPG
jgi:pyruvate/2-oxoglutarate dehydrogenase complex dihydrolipoamide dehydrogenase (E3) component